MITWGVSANHHDAAIAVVDGSRIAFAAHSERYSRVKNDPFLNDEIVAAALAHGSPDEIVWYEKPWLSLSRRIWAGQWDTVFRRDAGRYLRQFGLNAPVYTVGHHESHAAGGYFTSGFDDAAVLVVDAIGEWDTVSIWHGRGDSLRCIWRQRYPHSIGLLYSAMTQRIGFKPNEEEFIVMGAAAYGNPVYRSAIEAELIALNSPPRLKLSRNVHRGLLRWREDLTELTDMAASIQAIAEDYMVGLARFAKQQLPSTRCLVLSGGVALNCVANAKIVEDGSFDHLWIMPNPGDAGSSLGAIAAYRKRHLDWQGPYLGTDIDRDLPIADMVRDLVDGKVIGVANGRAEFGPRSLGNRSLIADPRPLDMKDKVNEVKKREPFRPFAPVVLAERASDYFEMPMSEIPYMQVTVKVKDGVSLPAVTHVDGSARVQTLKREQNPRFHALLTAFYEQTGCPVLLNTSLNVKGEPLVDTLEDAARFSRLNGITVY